MKNIHIILITSTFLLILKFGVSESESAPRSKWNQKLKPVVFIPGNGGCQIQAKLGPKARDRINTKCDMGIGDEWYRLWLDIWQLLPSRLECWADTIELIYNKTTKRTRNANGVKTKIPGWGDPTPIEYIDPSWTAWMMGDVGKYAATLVKELVSWGYERGRNILGAPYDFRYAPHSQQKYFKQLRYLVERAYRQNGETRIVIIAHSMGGLFGSYFLNHQSPKWKHKYIDTFISLNTPWKGTAMMPLLFASGYNWGVQALNPILLRHEQRTLETSTFLLPHPGTWKEDDAIVITSNFTYGVEDFDDFMKDIDYDEGIDMRKNVNEYRYDQNHPNVNTYCFYGSGVPTIEALNYTLGEFPEQQPIKIMGEGDGTVNLKSLIGCNQWLKEKKSTYETHLKHFPGASHDSLMQDTRMFASLKLILFHDYEWL